MRGEIEYKIMQKSNKNKQRGTETHGNTKQRQTENENKRQRQLKRRQRQRQRGQRQLRRRQRQRQRRQRRRRKRQRQRKWRRLIGAAAALQRPQHCKRNRDKIYSRLNVYVSLKRSSASRNSAAKLVGLEEVLREKGTGTAAKGDSSKRRQQQKETIEWETDTDAGFNLSCRQTNK